MRKIRTEFMAVLGISIMLSSCGSILFGGRQKVRIHSNPPGATVIMNGKETGKQTPCVLHVRRRQLASRHNVKNEINYILKKNGYEDYYYKDYRNLAMFFPLVGFCCGVMPGIIDLSVGSHLHYTKDVHCTLKPQKNKIPAYGKNSELKIVEVESDVDKNIPEIRRKNNNRIALIIGNEDYKSFNPALKTEANVDYAVHDAEIFAKYANKTLGVPSENIILLKNAKVIEMHRAIEKINKISSILKDKTEIVVYYAGHGFPDESNKEPYLIPVDVSATDLKFAISLRYFYNKITENNPKRITVFIDACFSGGARNQGLIAARAVKIKPKNEQIKGNIVVFTAGSGDETALGYKEKQHGLFTYFLLKKMQESKGKFDLKDMANYINEKVGVKSILVNGKPQTPQINISPTITDNWAKWNFYK